MKFIILKICFDFRFERLTAASPAPTIVSTGLVSCCCFLPLRFEVDLVRVTVAATIISSSSSSSSSSSFSTFLLVLAVFALPFLTGGSSSLT